MREKFGSGWLPPEDSVIKNLGMNTFSDDDFGGISNDEQEDDSANDSDNNIVKGKKSRRKNTIGSELNSEVTPKINDVKDTETIKNAMGIETSEGESIVNITTDENYTNFGMVPNISNHLKAHKNNTTRKEEVYATDISKDESEKSDSIENIFPETEIFTGDKESLPEINVDSLPTLGDIFIDTPSKDSTNQNLVQPNEAGLLNDNISLRAFSKFSNWDTDRKASNFERLTPIVEQILRVAGSDVDVQKYAHDLILTTDPDVERAQKELILDLLRLKIGASAVKISNPDDSTAIFEIVYDELLGLSVLGDLWRDDEITEIMVDRWDKITIEKNGKLTETNLKFKNSEHAASVARNLAIRISDRALSSSIPLVTAELPNARVTFAFGSVVKGGLSITLRKFRRLLTLEELKNKKSLNDEMVSFLSDAVKARAGILVSGGTGTGKTTIINLLSSFIPENERVITIEDAFELNISATHVVSLQTKEASSRDDQISITMADLLRNTLRMRPDRIIVGEIREGDGASVMLAAANTGHDGTMTTIHASSASLALNERLVDLVRDVRNSPDEAIKRTIISAFDLVVQVSRGRRGQRYISDIALVDRINYQSADIKPISIFIGEEAKDGTITHKKVGKVDSATLLGLKMSMSGIPEERWG